MFQPRIARRRTETDPRSLVTMQISNVGHQQNENKNKCSQKQQKIATKTTDPHAKVPSLYHTMKDLVKPSKTCAKNMA